MLNRSRALRGLAPVVLVLAAACSDRNPVGPGPVVPPEGTTVTSKLSCRVDVAQGLLECASAASPTADGIRAMIIGGQGVYVKLASSGTAYDGGTEILSTTVTVQNLLQQYMGTADSSTVTGVKVFFLEDPIVTSGTGTVSVVNPDGTGTFTSGSQPYFEYMQILKPYQISNGRLWQFGMPATVGSFSFSLLVETQVTTPQPTSGTQPQVLRGPVWEGDVSSDWTVAGNWVGDSIPTDSSNATIPPASLLAPTANMPVLTGNVTIAGLLVGAGSTLGLGGFTLQASGNVDASGTVSGGTLQMTGAGTVLNGNIDALVLTGSTTLQGATKATSAVSLQDGVLTVKDQALSISIP